MSEVYSQLPMPLFIGLMVFGVAVALIASMPTEWVSRVARYLGKRLPDISNR